MHMHVVYYRVLEDSFVKKTLQLLLSIHIGQDGMQSYSGYELLLLINDYNTQSTRIYCDCMPSMDFYHL